MATKNIHIGTSGYNYKHWRGPFYPEDLTQKKWLEFYAERFQTLEINNTFYNLPEKKTFEKWRDSVPQHFTFAVKASRYITHMKKLNEPKDALLNLFDHVQVLQDKFGPILFQLPPKWNVNIERLETFMDLLPKEFRYVFEFRDDSWWTEEVYELLSKADATFCLFELAGQQTPKELTSDLVYVRLHGPGDAYEGQYDSQTLSGWAGAFTTWRKQNKSIYCYFDNDQNGYAAQDAWKLKEMFNSK